MNFDNIWVEKYRPHTLDEMVLAADTRKLIESFNKQGEINHLLMVSSPGQGKTSLAKIIVKDMLKCDYLYINASDETGIDTIRTKVIGFAQTRSFDGGIKAILLDEADAMTGDSQRALRNVMEEYASNTRFILTANYKHKIIPAIQSRCIAVDFNHNLQDVVKHCYGILRKEKITIPDDQKSAFVELVKAGFPDFRCIINNLQKYSMSGVLNIASTDASNQLVREILDRVRSDVFEARKFVIQNESAFHADYHNLMKMMLQHIYNSNTTADAKRETILVLTEYMYRHVFVADAEINYFACMINLHRALQNA